MNQKRYRAKEKIEVWDIIHLILCVVVCVLTVLVFVDFQKNMYLFPFVFAAAGLMNLTTAARLCVADKKGKRNIPGACVFLLFALGLFVITLVGVKVCW